MPNILISAGHTVMDPGAIFKDLREADVTRKIAPKVIDKLQNKGFSVQGVPLDLPLWQRIEWINNTGFSDAAGDILVEVHINDADGTKRGLEAWYLANGANNSHKLAKTLVGTISADLGYEIQGLKSEYEHELGSLTFLNRSNPTPVLLETLFIDNDEDIKILKSDAKLDELAAAIAKGILKYLGKDASGKELAADQKPKYDDLKPFSGKPKAPAMNFPDLGELDDDLDDFDIPGGNSTPSFSAPKPATTLPFTMPQATPSMGGGFGGGSMPGMPKLGGMGGTNNNFMMDREQRKQMIEKVYAKILGRAPSSSDLNYFLNMGISEADLIKKMMDSQEHLDIVKAKQELTNLKTKSETDIQTLKKMQTALNDQKQMIEGLNQLITHKNYALAQMESLIQDKHGVPSKVVAIQKKQGTEAGISDKSNYKLHLSLSERILAFFSRKLS